MDPLWGQKIAESTRGHHFNCCFRVWNWATEWVSAIIINAPLGNPSFRANYWHFFWPLATKPPK